MTIYPKMFNCSLQTMVHRIGIVSAFILLTVGLLSGNIIYNDPITPPYLNFTVKRPPCTQSQNFEYVSGLYLL